MPVKPCNRCYDATGYVDPETKKVHAVICDHVEVDVNADQYVCAYDKKNPIQLFRSRLMLAGRLANIWIEPPVEGCPNNGPARYIIGMLGKKPGETEGENDEATESINNDKGEGG